MKLFKNAKIYTMEDEVIEKGYIITENSKIKKVKSGEAPQLEYDEVYDLEGKIVVPGFIDAHSHLGLSEEGVGLAGEDTNEAVDPITPHIRAIDGINPMDQGFQDAIEGGITTVASGPGSANVIGGSFAAIKTYGDRIDNMIIKDPIAMKVAFGENPKRVYSSKGKSPSTRMATVAELRNTLKKAYEYRDKSKSENPTFDFKLESLLPVLEREIPLKAHAHRADDIFSAIRIAKEFNIDLTLDHCTEGHLIADHLKEENYPCIVGPTMTSRSKVEIKNKSFKTAKELMDRGLLVAITTDAPVIPIQDLNICAGLVVKEGLDYIDALKTITINPAKILKLDDRIGSIKEGKDADFSVWTDDPILSLKAENCKTVIDGKIVYSIN